MKATSLSLATAFITLFAAMESAKAEQSDWGSVGNVTIALTLTTKDPALQAKDESGKIITDELEKGPTFQNEYSVSTFDKNENEIKRVSTYEYGSKFFVFKYGNAQFLEELVEADLLPEKGKAPHIAGWSIVATYNGGGELSGLYARHTDKTFVSLNELILIGGESEGFALDASAVKHVMTANTPVSGPESHSQTYSSSSSIKGVGHVTINSPVSPIPFTGLFTSSVKAVLKTETVETVKTSFYVSVPGAVKIDKVIGQTSGEYDELVEGSVSITAGVLTNMTTYFPTPK